MPPKKKIISVIIAAAVILAVVLIAVWAAHSDERAQLREGRAYLESVTSQSVGTVQNTVKEKKHEIFMDSLEEKRTQLENGETDVWSLFQDYCVLGDSRAVGFSYYKLLSEDRVFAESGMTIRGIEDYYDKITALNPSNIFLAFGLNDLLSGFWSTPEEYTAEYLSIIQNLQEKCPNATIYINSILPTTDSAYEQSEKWSEIPDYNTALEQMCRDNNLPYINNDEIVADHTDLYDADGIHFLAEFYTYWGTNMILTEYQYEAEGTTFTDDSSSSSADTAASDSTNSN